MRMMRFMALVSGGLVSGLILAGCGSKEPEAPAVPEPGSEPVARAPRPIEVPEPVTPEPEPPKEEPEDFGVQGSPQTLIRAFFAAAQTNGIEELSKLVMPRVRSSLSDPEWIELWSAHTITAIGDEFVEKKTPTTGAERTVAVPVVFQDRETGEVLEEKLQMSLKEGRWYWDDK